MKKLILLFFMCFAVLASTYAQIKFMPKIGGSLSKVSFSEDFFGPDVDIKPKIGIIVGVAAEIPLIGETLALQPELLFHQKGFKFDDPGDGEYTEEGSATLNYLELPVLAKIKFGKFYAIAGPSFSYGIGGKYKSTLHDLTQGTTDESSSNIKFKERPDNYQGDDVFLDNAFDMGVQLGVGMKISVIVIDLRYGMGLTNLYDKPDGSPYDYKSKNGSVQLTVGIPLPMGD